MYMCQNIFCSLLSFLMLNRGKKFRFQMCEQSLIGLNVHIFKTKTYVLLHARMCHFNIRSVSVNK